jgi:hypothetical protein
MAGLLDLCMAEAIPVKSGVCKFMMRLEAGFRWHSCHGIAT